MKFSKSPCTQMQGTAAWASFVNRIICMKQIVRS